MLKLERKLIIFIDTENIVRISNQIKQIKIYEKLVDFQSFSSSITIRSSNTTWQGMLESNSDQDAL